MIIVGWFKHTLIVTKICQLKATALPVHIKLVHFAPKRDTCWVRKYSPLLFIQQLCCIYRHRCSEEGVAEDYTQEFQDYDEF